MSQPPPDSANPSGSRLPKAAAPGQSDPQDLGGPARPYGTIPLGQAQALLEHDIDLRGFFQLLWRQKILILAVTVLCLAVAWVGLRLIPPIYTAEALIKMDIPGQSGLHNAEVMLASGRDDKVVLLGEVEVIKSRRFLREIIRQNGLENDPELQPPRELQERVPGISQDQPAIQRFRPLNLDMSRDNLAIAALSDRRVRYILDRLQERLRVTTVDGTPVISIAYNSRIPEQAARIANAIADHYLKLRLSDYVSGAQDLTNWFEKRLESLREDVRNAEAAVMDFRLMHQLLPGNEEEVKAQQLMRIHTELLAAESRKSALQARLERLEETELQNEGVFSSAETQALLQERGSLETEVKQLSQRYGPKHPRMIAARKALRDFTRRINGEVERAATALSHEIDVVQAEIEALETRRSALETQQRRQSQNMLTLRALEREADTSRVIYQTFLETHKHAAQSPEFQDARAEIISFAAIPDPNEPSFPDLELVLSLVGIFGFFCGVGLALLLEQIDNAYQSAGQLEEQYETPCLGLIPAVEGLTQEEIGDYILSKPATGLAEAVRSLHTVLKLRPTPIGTPPRVITMTSSHSGEGKTTLSCWLARIAARSGERVLLIDGDLRRPSVHKLIPGNTEQTLIEYLTGGAKLESVIQKDPDSDLHVMYARSVPSTALDLIGSKRMKTLLKSLRQAYDLIIIDAPAALAVSDPRVLGVESDQTLYCVAWNETGHGAVANGVKQFHDLQYPYLGFVLTHVDVERHARYGYTDFSYYHGRDDKIAAAA